MAATLHIPNPLLHSVLFGSLDRRGGDHLFLWLNKNLIRGSQLVERCQVSVTHHEPNEELFIIGLNGMTVGRCFCQGVTGP